MPIDGSLARAHEWIGLRVRVLAAADPSHQGVVGLVEDETRNMFTIRTNGRTVKVPKEKTSFMLELPDRRTVSVEGSSMKHRPEDRIKKAVGKW